MTSYKNGTQRKFRHKNYGKNTKNKLSPGSCLFFNNQLQSGKKMFYDLTSLNLDNTSK